MYHFKILPDTGVYLYILPDTDAYALEELIPQILSVSRLCKTWGINTGFATGENTNVVLLHL